MPRPLPITAAVRRFLTPGSWPTFSTLLAATLLAVVMAPSAASGQTSLKQTTATFFASHCLDCHGDGSAEGGLRLDTLTGDLAGDLANEATFARWERIFDRVAEEEMPPEDAEQPSPQQRESFLRSLRSRLHQAHAATKGVVLRRLNRREYQNTLNDMFGVQLDLESQLPEDGRSHEFDNVGEALSVSMVQLQRYLDAADQVIEAAVAKKTAPPEPKLITASYADTREGKTHIGKSWKLLDDGAVVFFRSGGYPSGMLRDANTRHAGRYKIRVTAHAYQSDRPITYAIGATTFQRGAERPTFAYRMASPGKPATTEVEAWIEDRYMVEITPWGIHDSDNVIRKEGVDAYRGPGLAVLEVELEGPLVDEFPSRGQKLLYDGLRRVEIEPANPRDKQRPWYEPKFEIQSDDPAADARQALLRVARQAFRRPVGDADVDRYVRLFESQFADEASLDEALRTAVAALLCSPDFLYFREPPGWLDDHAVATRLAYFLTRTLPDQPLLAAADRGELTRNPQILIEHVRRLLADPRHERFIVDFTDAWLNLRDIDFTSPDQQLFPEHDAFLQHSMLAETREFFDTLIQENLHVVNLVKSDFAMLNNRLAEHYEIEGVEGPELRRVALPPESVRGGILSQASVLKVSANGANTSPVVRGVWVTERILGKVPPPPPAGVAGVEPDIRGASTLRELLDKHRNLDTCRSCHEMIDPPGFALESFNPIGGWRDRFRSLGEGDRSDAVVNGRRVRYKLGPPVDASGELPGGESFEGYIGFRDALAAREDLLAKTLITKLLVFGAGREMGFSDREPIDRLVQQSRARQHRFRDIIELVVTSELFGRK